MKNFIFKIVTYTIIFLILAYPLDILISNILKKSTYFEGEFEVWNSIYEGNLNCDIAIYGASRAWVHIDPKVMKDTFLMNTYNFGIDGHNFWLQYLRHIEYFKYNKHPKIIIHSVDAFTLQKKNELFNLNQFLPYMLNNKNIKVWTSQYKGFNNLDYTIPLLRYRNKGIPIYNALINNLKYPIYRTNGYRGRIGNWNSDFENAIKHKKSYYASIDKKSLEQYKLFLKECKSFGIKVILVYTPEHVVGQNYIKNRSDVLLLYKKIAHDFNLSFLDYSNDTMCSNKLYFYNATHLNNYGSEIFSKKLAHDLKKSILIDSNK